MSLLDVIFPKSCLNCKRSGKYLCQSCLSSVPFANTICPVCERFSFYGKTHERCIREGELDGLVNIWLYRGVIRKSIIKIKYKFMFDIAKELGKQSEIELRKFKLPRSLYLVPIPLHKTRNNWRGFNHAEKLAVEISKISGFKLIPNLLMKDKDTHPQVHLSKIDRHSNLSGKFRVNTEVSKTLSKNVPIFLFDDVWTTGSTLKEACVELKKAGFKKVWGITIARS